MKKIKAAILLFVFGASLTTSVTSQAQSVSVTADEIAFNIIDSFKKMTSLSTDLKLEIDAIVADSDDEVWIEVTGEGDLIISPRLEFGVNFDGQASQNDEEVNGSVEAYLVGDEIYSYLEDSTSGSVGQWERFSAAESLGFNPSQFSMFYQMFLSVYEGIYRGVFVPSEANELLADYTTIEELSDGYKVTIKAFETAEEWQSFFEAVGQLSQDLATSENAQLGVEVDVTNDFDPAELADLAEYLAENISYELVTEVNQDFQITSLIITASSQANLASSDFVNEEIPEGDLRLELTDVSYNQVKEITLPQEALGN